MLFLISCSANPAAEICRAVHKHNSPRAPAREGRHHLSIDAGHLPHVQLDGESLRLEGRLQLCDVFPIDTAAEKEDDRIGILRPNDFEHPFFRGSTLSFLLLLDPCHTDPPPQSAISVEFTLPA